MAGVFFLRNEKFVLSLTDFAAEIVFIAAIAAALKNLINFRFIDWHFAFNVICLFA